MKNQQFLGTARTLPSYRIFDLGSYPGLIDWPEGTVVFGELYRVDERCLIQLDDAEGVADGLYARREIFLDTSTLPTSVNGNVIFYAWFWLHSVAGRADCGKCWPA